MSDGSSVAFSRIEKLLDPGSFVEIGGVITARNTDFVKDPKTGANDGVITGHGLIDGNLVFVFGQDSSVLGGTIGEMHARKICNIFEMAKKVGAPVVGMFDSKGIRLMESADAAESLGAVIGAMAKASGVVPMVSAVFGQLGGGMAAMAGISDFVFMEDKAHIFVNPPDGIVGVNKDKYDPSGAQAQYKESYNVDGIGSEDEILGSIRELVALIPGSAMEEGRVEPPIDDMNRILDSSYKTADTDTFVSLLADDGFVFKAKDGCGPNFLTGIMRMGGRTVGVIANRRDEKGKPGHFGARCTLKAAKFVKFLDAFSIPILTITDVNGYNNEKLVSEFALPGVIADFAINLATADVAKINLVRNAQSSAYLFMNSKSLSADLVYAYPDSKMEILDVDVVANAISEETKDSVDDVKKKLSDEIFGAKNYARRGFVDSLIDFSETRKYLIAGFDMLYTKSEIAYKKHEAR